MKILDWYILKKFLFTFFYTVLLIVVIFCVIDYTENNDDFIKRSAPFHLIINHYYLNYIPYLANFLSPIMIFIAAILVTSRLAGHTEIVAMLSSGISFARVLRPYFIGSGLMAIATFFLLAYVLPGATKERVAFERKYMKNQYLFEQQDIHLKLNDSTYAYIRDYNNISNVGNQFSIETIVGTELKQKMTATRVMWDSAKAAWTVNHWRLRDWTPGYEVITEGASIDTVINMHPDDFQSKWKEEMTLNLDQLNEKIRMEKKRGIADTKIFQVEYYERFSYPFAVIIMTIIGVVVSARKQRGGIGYHLALGFVLTLLYAAIVHIGRTFAVTGEITPIAYAIFPNALFGAIGYYLYRRLPK